MIYTCLLLGHKKLLIQGNTTMRTGRWMNSRILDYRLITPRRIFASALLFGVLQVRQNVSHSENWKIVANLFSTADDATRTFIYETNVFENGKNYSCTTTTVYSTRGYLGCHRPHMALSEKYLVELRATGFESNNTKRWTLVLTEYNPNDQGQVIAFVSLRKGENAPVVSASSCLQFNTMIFTPIIFLQRWLFFTTSDMVVVIGPAFLSLYPIQDLKMHHKKLVLPLHRIKLAWDDISRPFYDRGLTG